MGSRGRCLQPRQGAHKPASEEATTVDDNGTNEGGQTDWCTCIEQMQWFTILFLWNKESCVLHKRFDFILSFYLLKKASIFCH